MKHGMVRAGSTTALLLAAGAAWSAEAAAPGAAALAAFFDGFLGRHMLFMIALCGCVGGIVDGLTHNISYKLALPVMVVGRRVRPSVPGVDAPRSRCEVELGVVGDAAVGLIAAFSVFAFSYAAFPGVQDVQLQDEKLRVIGLALLAGWLGPRLLRLVSDKLENAQQANARAALAQSKAEESEQARQLHDSVQPLLDYANRQLTINATAKIVAHVDPAARARLLERARMYFQFVVEIDPKNVNARFGLAGVYGAQADLKRQQGGTPQEIVDLQRQSVKMLEEVFALDPRSAKALYNLACMKALANQAVPGSYPATAVFQDLRAACNLLSLYRQYAQLDDDFQRLREHPPRGVTPEDLALIMPPLAARAARQH